MDDMTKREYRHRFAGLCRSLRRGYPQADFAKQYGLSTGAVQDLEQGRVVPSRAVIVLLHAIRMQPEFIQRAAKEAAGDLALLDEMRKPRN